MSLVLKLHVECDQCNNYITMQVKEITSNPYGNIHKFGWTTIKGKDYCQECSSRINFDRVYIGQFQETILALMYNAETMSLIDILNSLYSGDDLVGKKRSKLLNKISLACRGLAAKGYLVLVKRGKPGRNSESSKFSITATGMKAIDNK